MKRKPAPKRQRSLRRTPDARALEWATAKLERAEKLHQWHTEKLQGLHSEIPRLRGIIAALAPTGVHVSEVGTLTPEQIAAMPNGQVPMTWASAPQRKPRIVAGMDVSKYVQPRNGVAVPEPVMTDSEDALIDAVDGILPKGTDLSQ